MDDYFLIAEIQDSYDEDGSVIIRSFSDFPERFLKLEKIFIDFFGKRKVLEIEYTKKIKKSLVAKFRNFNSIEDIHFLIGKKLYIVKDDLHELPEETFYIHDLIDSKVYLDTVFFGKLVDVLKLPNNDVYVIRKNNNKELLVPAVKKFIMGFNRDKQILYLDPECKILDENEN